MMCAWFVCSPPPTQGSITDTLQALQAYSRAVPEVTYVDLEKVFRQTNLNTFLIATVSGRLINLILFSHYLGERVA